MKRFLFSAMIMMVVFLLACSGNKSTDPTGPNPPTVTTAGISAIANTSAVCGGTVTADGGASVTARGVCWSTGSSPTTSDSKTSDGSGTGSFVSAINNLTPGTTYYVRAYATNSDGTGYGNSIMFTTVAELPTVLTTTIYSITQTSAVCGGEITYEGSAPVSARGVCWKFGSTPTVADNKTVVGNGMGTYESPITSLAIGTTYFVRAYATSNVGTAYGDELRLRTTDGTITDIDGNIYQVVKIGTQWWMAENLKVTHYRNGDAIPNVSNYDTWRNLYTGAYCEYDNDPVNVVTYGRLYNGYAVFDSRNIAPAGWHVPTYVEWQALSNSLGITVAGGKIKETGTLHWLSPNIGATNEAGFSALPSGSRHYSQSQNYDSKGEVAIYWTSTRGSSYFAWSRSLHYLSTKIQDSIWVNYPAGLAVRCIKD